MMPKTGFYVDEGGNAHRDAIMDLLKDSPEIVFLDANDRICRGITQQVTADFFPAWLKGQAKEGGSAQY